MATKTKAKNDWRELEQDDLIEAIVDARESQGLSWSEIKEMSGGMAMGKLMFLRDVGTVDEKDRIKFRTEADLPAKIQAARDENVSWGLIAARTGLPPSRIRKIYEDEYGEGSSRLDGGMERVKGRRGVVAEPPEPKPKKEKAAAKPKKAAAKKAPAKKASTAKSDSTLPTPLVEMDLEQLQERLDGKTITVKNETTGKLGRIKVKSVTATDGEEMEFVAGNGATRTVVISKIQKASR